jgi:hypothetical protein
MGYIGRSAGLAKVDAIGKYNASDVITRQPVYVIDNRLFGAPYCFFIDTERSDRKDKLRAVTVEDEDVSKVIIESLYDENFVPYDAIIARHGAKGIAVVADGKHGHDILQLLDDGKNYLDALHDGIPKEVETGEGKSEVKAKIGLVMDREGKGGLAVFDKKSRHLSEFTASDYVIPYVSTYTEASGQTNQILSGSAPSSLFTRIDALKLATDLPQELSDNLYNYLKDNVCGRYLNSVSCAISDLANKKWLVASTNRVPRKVFAVKSGD